MECSNAKSSEASFDSRIERSNRDTRMEARLISTSRADRAGRPRIVQWPHSPKQLDIVASELRTARELNAVMTHVRDHVNSGHMIWSPISQSSSLPL